MRPWPALALGATEDVVGGDAEEARHDLGERERLAIAFLACVGREWLGWLVRDLAIRIDFELHRGREAFGLGIAGLTADDERDHRALSMPRLEEPDLLIDVVALGSGRRADHDQSRGGVERRKRLVGQRVSRGEVIAVAEGRAERLGYCARCRLTADQVLVDRERFDHAM